ncbi:patatin-like phospholipase family protein [Kiritimatiellaeota bacterium B1221]|nr:patatin-like phospholipase family protein [Kiritimatiellaeota bacterium B1221]
MNQKAFTLALGAGGARGFAHLKILEVLDQHHVKPSCIAGASIGALVGALYATGASSQTIQHLVKTEWVDKLPQPGGMMQKILKPFQAFRWVRLNLDGSSALHPEKIIDFLLSHFGVENFEDLQIPLKVVATDYWSGEEVLFTRGPLKPALMATMAIAGIFPPVEFEDKLLFDGGYANGLPVSHIKQKDTRSIAVDVPLKLVQESESCSNLNLSDYSQNMVDRLLSKNIQHQLDQLAPDFYLACPIHNIGIMSFDKVEQVYRQTDAACEQLTRQLRSWEIIS